MAVNMPDDRLARKRAEADTLFHRFGITFAVYGGIRASND